MQTGMRWICRVAGLIVAITLTACGGSSASSTSLSTGASTPSHLTIMVDGLAEEQTIPNMLAKQLGYFGAEQLDVTLVDQSPGQHAADAVLAGQIEAGSGAYYQTIAAHAAGKNLRCVVQLTLAPGMAVLVGSKAGSPATLSALKGKNIGIDVAGSPQQTVLAALLSTANLTLDMVHLIPVGSDDSFIAALQSGRIDAGITTEPTASRAIAKGIASVLSALRTPANTQAALGGAYPFGCVFLTQDYIAKHHDTVQHLVNAYVKTLRWMQAHTAADIAAKLPPDYGALDKARYVMTVQGLSPTFSPDGSMPASGPPSVLSFAQKTDPTLKGKTIDLTQTFTNDFASAAKG